MSKRKESLFLIEICLCLIFVVSSFAEPECDKTKCPGPLRYYEDVRCKPIYKNPGDCCAVKYDCSHLQGRSKTKCYVNNNVYNIGDKLKDEDAQSCDINCVCVEGFDGIAKFNCAVVDCFQRAKPGCYLEHSPDKCCANQEICPENPATCIVDGKTLKEGEYFEVEGQPHTSCYCKPGYKGENVEPFCHTLTGSFCGTEMRHSYEINKKCAPVYYYEQSPQTSCSVSFRCQNGNDTLISNPENLEKSAGDESDSCTYGTIAMRIGDELNQATDYSSVCVKCKCEVPPIPTCQRLPDDECDVTVHPKFDSFDS